MSTSPGGSSRPPGRLLFAWANAGPPGGTPARRRLFVRRPSLCARAPGRARSTWGLVAGAVLGPRRPSGALSFGAVCRGRLAGGPLWLPPSSARPPLGPPRGGAGVVDVPVPTSRGKPTAAPLALNLISAPQISSRALLLFGYLHYRSPTEFEHF